MIRKVARIEPPPHIWAK